MASIFTRIARGEIPCIKVYENDLTLAFMDINPASRGHVLVISKEEHADIHAIPGDTLAAVALAAKTVASAIRDALKPDGINIVQNNGKASGQEVFHYHVHLIPRWEGDGALGLWRPKPGDKAELSSTAEAIRTSIS